MPRDLPSRLDTAKDGIVQSHNPQIAEAKGQVRIRSNVCKDPNAWHLVPGDELKRHNLHYHNLTSKQHDELMYYDSCSICCRRIYEIDEDGCDHPICQGQGIPSSADAARRKSRYVDNNGANSDS